MGKTKREHYVPQCYLERFTKGKHKIFVYDKVTRRSFQTTLPNIAQERYFYDMPAEIVAGMWPGHADPQLVEKTIAKLESHYNADLAGILKDIESLERIRRSQQELLAPYIVFQWVRTRQHREFLMESGRKLCEALADDRAKRKLPGLPEESRLHVALQPKAPSVEHARHMFNVERLMQFAKCLLGHIWIIGINKSIQPFYTSDHPVVKRANLQHPCESFAGLGSPGIEIAFPLTSRHIVVMCERSCFRQMEKFHGRALLFNAFGVERYNCLQVMKSYRQVYCEADQFEQAEGVCRRYPEVCVPDRPRVEVRIHGDIMGMHLLD